MWLQEQFEFVVRRYGPDGCRRNDATCREVFEHFKFADAQDLSAEQIANVRSVVKSIHPGKRLSTEIAHNPDLPQELRRMPNDSVEWQAQVNVVHRLVEQRDKATKENRASKDNLQHAVIETIGAPVFEGLQSVGMDKLLGSFAEAISQQWIAKVWEAHGAPVPIPEGYEVLVGARQRVMKPSDLGRKEVDLGRTVENQGSIRWASIGESVSSFVKRWRRVLKTDYKRRYNGPWRPPFR
jgi:hypothetical protein